MHKLNQVIFTLLTILFWSLVLIAVMLMIGDMVLSTLIVIVIVFGSLTVVLGFLEVFGGQGNYPR